MEDVATREGEGDEAGGEDHLVTPDEAKLSLAMIMDNARVRYHGDIRDPAHLWTGSAKMQTIKANISHLSSSVKKKGKLQKIVQSICEKWPGLPRVKAVFDADGHELSSSAPVSGISDLFRREHDWDKSFDGMDDRIFVTHCSGREEIATVAVTYGQQCLVSVMRDGEPTAKQVGNLSRYVERAVLVDRTWLRGHMLDVVLKNCTRLTDLFDEKIECGEVFEQACPRGVMDARIEDAVINGSTSRSAVEFTLFSNIDPGEVTVKIGKHCVHVQVRGGAGELGGILVLQDARIRRILAAYVPPNAAHVLDGPEHRHIARWLVILLYLFLTHVVHTKDDHHSRFERYNQTLGRHKWAVPMLLHMVSCDVLPNFSAASAPSRRTHVRIVKDAERMFFVSTDKHTAMMLDAPFGEFKRESQLNLLMPSCVAPGTSGFGIVASGEVQVGPTAHHLNIYPDAYNSSSSRSF